MPMFLHALCDRRSIEHVESRKQRCRPMSLVIMRHRSAAPLLQGQARLCAIQRLDLRLFVERQHHSMGRRVDIETDDIAKLLGKLLVVGQLEASDAMGLEAVLAPMRCTELTLMPGASAIAAAVQWVVSPGGSFRVSATTRATTSTSSGGMRDGRVLSRNSPPTPSTMNRSCQRQIEFLSTPPCRSTSFIPTPPPLNKTIRARHTCFCGLLRSATIPSSRTRSAELTSTLIPLRMYHVPDSHGGAQQGIHKRRLPLEFIH